MSKLKWMAGSCFALALALLAWGCAGKAGAAVPLEPSAGGVAAPDPSAGGVDEVSDCGCCCCIA